MNKNRIPVIAGNWKMNKTRDEALQFIYTITPELPKNSAVETVICSSPVLLRCLVKRQGENLRIGAQTMHQSESGAFTGEVSPLILKNSGVEYVIIGHSERRAYYNETDETVNQKVLAAFKYDLKPIACCGETLEERESNKTEEVIKKQVVAMMNTIPADIAKDVIIAYEPIWAIGTGKTATKEMAEETCGFVRSVIDQLYGKAVSDKIRILYGGSVTPANVSELLAQTNIDGALVGGASLDPENFLKLVKAAKN